MTEIGLISELEPVTKKKGKTRAHETNLATTRTKPNTAREEREQLTAGMLQ